MALKITAPGEYHEQIMKVFRSRVDSSISVLGYDDIWHQEIISPCVLIQLEDSHPGPRHPSGKYTHRVTVTAHCVLPTSIPKAMLQTADLAAEVERIVDGNNFGIALDCCGLPEIQVNGDTTFLFGIDGMVARGVQWIQPLYLGRDWFADFPGDELRAGVRLAVNPAKPDAPDEYHAFLPRTGGMTGE